MIGILKRVFFLLFYFGYRIGEEFCIFETFKPICSNYERLVIRKDNYGRRKFGECIKKGENIEALSKISGYINCYTDVRHILNLNALANKAFKLYLEIEYDCMKG